MAYFPPTGSTVAFQSDPTKLVGTVSVVGLPTNQNVSGSVVAFQGTNPWAVSPSGNQSVSGTVGASIIGLPPVNVTNANLNVSGSVVSFQGTDPWRITANNSSVITVPQGSIAAAIVSGSVAVATGNSSVQVLNFPTNQNVSGSVVAFQGTDPWRVTANNASIITVPQSSTAVAIVSGSIAATFTPPANQSVSGTVGASIIGLPPVNVTNTNLNVGGSVVAFQGTSPWIITGSVQGSFSPSGNQSVSGTVGTSVIGTVPITQSGTMISSIVNTVPSSVIVGSSIFGQLPAGTAVLGSVAALQGTSPWIITGSVQGSFSPAGNQSVSGTVGASVIGLAPVAAQGINAPTASVTGNPVYVAGSDPNGSVAALKLGAGRETIITGSIQGAVSVLGTVPVTQSGTNITSIVGAYAEDAGHTSGDTGVFTLAVRNDTMASVTSADIDYSPVSTGPVGEVITANAPITKWVQGTGSMLGGTPVNGGSVALIAAQGSSIFTYITGIQITNASANNVWLRFDGATSSVVGYAPAPANGGAMIVLPNAWKTNANAAFTASISGVASVYLAAEGFISKT